MATSAFKPVITMRMYMVYSARAMISRMKAARVLPVPDTD